MTLQIGDKAPEFTLTSQHGEQVSLADFRGSKAVVVVFYPFAFSGVCTGELSALRDRLPELDNDDVALVAVSCDPMFSLRSFADAEGLTFPLLSDFWPHGEAASAYGVFDDQKGCARRGTYIVDRDGALRWMVENDIPDARDVDSYTRALATI